MLLNVLTYCAVWALLLAVDPDPPPFGLWSACFLIGLACMLYYV